MKFKLKALFNLFKIVGITFDSREVKPFFAFFAINGNKIDGNKYIDEALAKGAKLIFTDNLNLANEKKVPNIFYLNDIRKHLSLAASLFYPKLPKYLFAITGTNGKTSTAHYVQQLIELLGENSISIGTLGINGAFQEELRSNYVGDNLTTPDPILLRKILNNAAEKDINYVALEAGSHGIDQNRLFSINMHACAFTSFSQDHLDYHHTIENYLFTKLKLFAENLTDNGIIILNSDMEMFPDTINHLNNFHKKIITIGLYGTVKIINILSQINGQEVTFSYDNIIYNFTTSIIGNFQIYNILIAVMLVYSAGFKLDEIANILNKLKAPLGRLERVTNENDNYQIFIDYAHTPDAIKQALSELMKLKGKGKLKIIFGCGGNRDQSKRKIMGEIATLLADEVIITDDNPRMEEPKMIRKEILEGAKNATEIENREQAIKETIFNLEKDDILLIAGKGHEDYQIIGEKKIFFSDILIAKQALHNKNGLVK